MKTRSLLTGAFALTLAGALLAAGTAHAQLPPRPGSPSTGAHSTPSRGMQQPPMGQPGADQMVFNQGYVDHETIERSQKQMSGEYPQMERSLGIPLGMTQDAWSTPFKNMAPGQGAPGVVRFQWSPDLIMPVRIRDFMVTMLVLPDWEEAIDVFIGEAYYMQAAIVRQNVVAIRSSQSGIDTTLSIVGRSGNIYSFYIRAEGFNTRKLTDIQVFVEAPPSAAGNDMWFKGNTKRFGNGQVQMPAAPQTAPFAPPVPGPTAPAAIQMPATAQPPGSESISNPGGSAANGAMVVPRDQMIFNMRMFEVAPGDREIAPDFVYTDGVWTYFHYSSKARSVDRPVVYRVVDGVESRVNTRTAGRFGEVIIAEALGDFVLRNGGKTVCVKRNDQAAAAQ